MNDISKIPNIASFLRQLRGEDLTTYDIAVKLNVSQGLIAMYENATATPTDKAIRKYSREFNVPELKFYICKCRDQYKHIDPELYKRIVNLFKSM